MGRAVGGRVVGKKKEKMGAAVGEPPCRLARSGGVGSEPEPKSEFVIGMRVVAMVTGGVVTVGVDDVTSGVDVMAAGVDNVLAPDDGGPVG